MVRPSAWEAALKLLAMQARSTEEVRQRLERRGYSSNEIVAVLGRLVSAKYLDDLDFARTWVRSRAGRCGPARLAWELRAKGIGEADIDAALLDLRTEASVGEVAEVAAARKLRGLDGLDPAVARRRLAAYLERQGFAQEVVLALCQKYFPAGTDPDEGR